MGSVAQGYRYVEVIDGAYKGARGIAFSKNAPMFNKDNVRVYYILYKGTEVLEFGKPISLKCREIKKHESLKGVSNGENN